MPRPPDDIINKRACPASDLPWGRGLLRWMGAVGPGAALKANLIVDFFSDYPLKNMIDGNLVFPRPPDEIINKRVYPASDLLWGRGLSRRNGRCRTGGGAVSQFDCRVFFRILPLKNMMDGNLVFPVPPDDIIKKRA
jgi:hypothetical protein